MSLEFSKNNYLKVLSIEKATDSWLCQLEDEVVHNRYHYLTLDFAFYYKYNRLQRKNNDSINFTKTSSSRTYQPEEVVELVMRL